MPRGDRAIAAGQRRSGVRVHSSSASRSPPIDARPVAERGLPEDAQIAVPAGRARVGAPAPAIVEAIEHPHAGTDRAGAVHDRRVDADDEVEFAISPAVSPKSVSSSVQSARAAPKARLVAGRGTLLQADETDAGNRGEPREAVRGDRSAPVDTVRLDVLRPRIAAPADADLASRQRRDTRRPALHGVGGRREIRIDRRERRVAEAAADAAARSSRTSRRRPAHPNPAPTTHRCRASSRAAESPAPGSCCSTRLRRGTRSRARGRKRANCSTSPMPWSASTISAPSANGSPSHGRAGIRRPGQSAAPTRPCA